MNRADRRRREKDDERAISRGLSIERRDPEQVGSLMRLLHREVLKARQTGSVATVFQLLHGNLAKTAVQAPRDIVACRKGCSSCCKMWVSVTAPEVFQLVRAVRSSRLDVRDIEERAAVTAGLDFDTRGSMIYDCPLLASDGSCSVYPARPMACRTAASQNAEVCRRGYTEFSGEDIPTPFFFILQRTGYNMAMRGAFLHAGLRLETYELNAALSVALATENAERRWLGGGDIFAGVPTDPHPNPIDQPEAAWFVLQTFAE